jgi:hypothetical protein
MTKTEAAEILARYITRRANETGKTTITDLVIDTYVTEARTELHLAGTPIYDAGMVRPTNRTIKAAGRKAQAERSLR